MSASAEIEAYLAALPDERREAVSRLISVIDENIPAGFERQMSYGAPGWVVPHTRFPAGYHCDPKLPLPFLSVASQKAHIALYHMGLYADPELLEWFTTEYADRVPRKLDMGKSCVRFKKPDAIPFDLIGELCSKMTVDGWIARYEGGLQRP